MKKNRVSVAAKTIAILLISSSIANASGGGSEGGGIDIMKEIARFFNFFVVVGTLYYFGGKLAREFFNKRKNEIANMLNEADAGKKAAEEKLADLDAKSTEIHVEIEVIKKNAKEEGDFIKNEIIKSAKAEADKILKKAELEIALEAKKVRTNLKREASKMAIDLAEQIVKKEIKPDDQKKLIQKFVDTVEVPA